MSFLIVRISGSHLISPVRNFPCNFLPSTDMGSSSFTLTRVSSGRRVSFLDILGGPTSILGGSRLHFLSTASTTA